MINHESEIQELEKKNTAELLDLFDKSDLGAEGDAKFTKIEKTIENNIKDDFAKSRIDSAINSLLQYGYILLKRKRKYRQVLCKVLENQENVSWKGTTVDSYTNCDPEKSATIRFFIKHINPDVFQQLNSEKVEAPPFLKRFKANPIENIEDRDKTKLDESITCIISEYEKNGKDVFDNFNDIYTFIYEHLHPNFEAMLGADIQQKFLCINHRNPKNGKNPNQKIFEGQNIKISMENTGKLDAFTLKVFSIYLIEFSKTNHYSCKDTKINPIVDVSLDTFIKYLGKPNTKSSKDKLRRQIKESQYTLFKSVVELTLKRGGKQKKYDMHMFLLKERKDLGLIFTQEMARCLIQSPVAFYSTKLLKIDGNNPIAFKIGSKLNFHYSIDNNQRTGKNNIISVKSLLKSCCDIPSYDDVIATGGQVQQRIITPFERALDHLISKKIITCWEYCNSKKTRLTDKQLSDQSYEGFKKRFIYFKIKDFPDQKKRLEHKNTKIIKSKKNKKAYL